MLTVIGVSRPLGLGMVLLGIVFLCNNGEFPSGLASMLLLDKLSWLISFSSLGISSLNLSTNGQRYHCFSGNSCGESTTRQQPDSPHGVEVVVRRNVVLVIAGQTQLVAVALMDKVPQFFWAQRLWTEGSGQNEVGQSWEHRAEPSFFFWIAATHLVQQSVLPQPEHHHVRPVPGSKRGEKVLRREWGVGVNK